MPIITTSTVYKSLKKTLDSIITDPVDSPKKDVIYPKWAHVKQMSDQWEDDLEVAGTLLLKEKVEGANADVGSIAEGVTTRYIARTWALTLPVSEESLDDVKYDQTIAAAKRLTKSAWKTRDIDMTNMLIRATNTSYPGGDTLPLASASHTLTYGGTYSNVAGTYQTPSRAALITATTAIGLYVSPNGLTEGYAPKKIVCPLAQWAVWEGILGSTLVPESNANEINVVKKLGLEVVPVKYLDASSTTFWGIVTDADDGLQVRIRKEFKSRTWVDNDAEVMKYGVSGRWARGWSNPRGWYQGNT